MKKSIYNFFINDEEKNIHLIYNSLKNSLIEDEDKRISNFINNNQTDKISLDPDLLSEEEFTALKEHGIIIDDSFDELEWVKKRHQKRIENIYESDEILSLVITPTLSCNFNCFYCFESAKVKKNESKMSPEIQDLLITFIKKSLQRGIKMVIVHWYGGEPLMEKEIIFNMQSQIKEVCDQHNAALSFGMITNGFLLDKKTSQNLFDHGMEKIQITIDGPEKVHNKRRLFKENPESNFKTIIQNIQNLPKEMRLNIRINVDYMSKDTIYDLVEELIEKKIWPYNNKVKIELGFVHAEHEQNNIPVVTKEEFLMIEDDFREYLMKRYTEISGNNDARFHFKYPTTGGGGCGYGSQKNYWVVDYEGYTYRCWDVVGMKNFSTGNIRNMLENFGHPVMKELLIDNRKFEKWGCFECKYFPICGGECPWEYTAGKDGIRRCSAWKYSLHRRLLRQYEMYKKNPNIFKTTLLEKI